MSITLMSAVWKSAEKVSPAKLLVMLKLADSASDEGYCWPSQSTIAEQCRLARPTVNNVINELQQEGKLTVAHRAGRSNIYRLSFSAPVSTDDTPSSKGVSTDDTYLSAQMTGGVSTDDTNHKRTINSEPSIIERTKRKARTEDKITRPDIVNDAEYVEWLSKHERYSQLPVPQRYREMLTWCERRSLLPSRLRLLNWLNKDLASVPMCPSPSNVLPLTSPPLPDGVVISPTTGRYIIDWWSGIREQQTG